MARKKIRTFEESIERIDKIIEQMEDDSASFNKYLDLYEEGLQLISDCSNQINTAQQKIYRLEDDFSLKKFDEAGEKFGQ